MYSADCLRFSNRQYSVTVRLWLVETNVADAHVKTRHLYGLYSYAASAGHCAARSAKISDGVTLNKVKTYFFGITPIP